MLLRFLGLLFIVVLFFAGEVFALTVETNWTYTEEDQAKITGFRIYDKEHVIVVDNISPNSRTITFEVDATSGNPLGWYLVAFVRYAEGDEDISWPSNMIVYCPDRVIPPSPTSVNMNPQANSAGADTFHGTFQ